MAIKYLGGRRMQGTAAERTALNLSSIYSRALIEYSKVFLSSSIALIWYFLALPATPSTTSPVVVEEPVKAQKVSWLGAEVKAESTPNVETEPALVFTVCLSILASGVKRVCTATLLEFLRFAAQSSVFNKVSKSPFFTHVVFEANPITLNVALEHEVVNTP